ncbi:uncharacterized protein [Prorops nasuta]|uniref:uncharacterized protein n=1 Tax=Prorops nasuta TaxID=863751 RepID=UPI0034CE9DF7
MGKTEGQGVQKNLRELQVAFNTGYRFSRGSYWTQDKNKDQCDTALRDIIQEDRSNIVDGTPTRLFATWLSQECEMRAGPEYVIRKYTFFENNTFTLIRHHYAEESCSVATHTVTARGSIKLLLPSLTTPGATEARFVLDSVHVIPLNRQVAHKFGHRLNVTCQPQARWRPYASHLVYEQPFHRYGNSFREQQSYNSLQAQHQARDLKNIDCLEQLGIEFGELRLLRVQKKQVNLRSDNRPRIELLLGALPPNPHVKWSYRPTSLQPLSLLRSDTISGCPICNSILRGTECSPPLLHEVADLPALLAGSWISGGCESAEGGLWLKRQLQIYSGDKLWNGRWNYYAEPKCTTFLYAISAAGSYEHRPGRSRRHGDFQRTLEKYYEQEKHLYAKYKRSLDEEYDVDSLHRENNKLGKSKIHSFDLNPRKDHQKNEAYSQIQNDLDETIFNTYEKEMSSSSEKRENDKLEKLMVYFSGLNAYRDHQRMIDQVESKRREELGGSELKGSKSKGKKYQNYKEKRSLDENIYRHLLQNAQPSMAESFAAMLRGHQKHEEVTTKRPQMEFAPTGTTELDLHVAESLLIPGDLAVAARYGGQRNRPLASWPKNCIPKTIASPSTVAFRAKVGVSWAGQYILLLGSRDDHLWDAPLQQCGPTPFFNPDLKLHLRRSVGLRYGFFTSSANLRFDWNFIIIQPIAFIFLYCMNR